MGSSLIHAIIIFPALCAVFGPDCAKQKQQLQLGDHGHERDGTDAHGHNSALSTPPSEAVVLEVRTDTYGASDIDAHVGKENQAIVIAEPTASSAASNVTGKDNDVNEGIEMATIATSGETSTSNRGPVASSSATSFVACRIEDPLPIHKRQASAIDFPATIYTIVDLGEDEETLLHDEYEYDADEDDNFNDNDEGTLLLSRFSRNAYEHD